MEGVRIWPLSNSGGVNSLGLARPAYAAPGDLDESFDDDGAVTTIFGSLPSHAWDLAIQPDNKTVVAGDSGSDFALARYKADGSLDTSFSTDGKLTTDFGSSSDNIQDVTIQPDGKVVVAGYTQIQFDGQVDDNAWALARYNSDGSLDTSFGTGGKLTTDFGPDFDRASAIAVLPDGKIVASGAYRAGDTVAGTAHDDFAIARYDSDGSLDTSFDTDGKVTTDFGPGQTHDVAYDMAIQDDGRIVLVGDSNQAFALARYNPDGSPSNTFDGDGKLVTSSLDNGGARAVGIQTDGKIVAAGGSWPSDSPGRIFTVARYFGGDDAEAPGPVTNFAYTAPKGAGTISLEWTNPTDSDFAATRVMRSQAGSACDPGFYDGRHDPNLTKVYEGQATSYLDSGMPFGTYCYVAFARDENGNWSEASKLAATPDDTRPVVTIDSGPSGDVSSLSASFTFSSDIQDATFQCSLDGAQFETCSSPKEYTHLAEGSHSFSVRGVNAAGHPGSEAVRSWVVVPESTSQAVAAGDTLSTDSENDGATAADPVETSVTSPVAGSVSITETSTTQPEPSGFSFFGQQITIEAPQATAQGPLILTFILDSSVLSEAGVSLNDLQLFRDGVKIEVCANGSSSTVASPDPCIRDKSQLADGDAKVTVLSSHASQWNFGKTLPTPLYSFQGFFDPVDNPPTFNSVKAGATVPVVFSLGGNQGLDILNGTPTSEPMAYVQGAPVDAIEKTVSATSSGLSYSKKLSTYTYNWTTNKSWAGTYRKFTLKLKDGTEHVAYFKFTKK
jgi:uncharacterized delta-60 repeat protein